LDRLVRAMKGRGVASFSTTCGYIYSKAVKAWLEEHREQSTVDYLPSFSLEFNFDEHLNRTLKS
jgi:hypothetical protein